MSTKLLAIVTSALSLVACGGSDSSTPETPPSTAVVAPQASQIQVPETTQERSSFTLSVSDDAANTEAAGVTWEVIGDMANVSLSGADTNELTITVGELIEDTTLQISATLTNSEGSDSESITIALDEIDFDALPPLPTPVEANAEIIGIDSDNNGVRDEVDHIIYSLFPESAENREKLANGATIFQNLLVQSNRSASMNFPQALTDYIYCSVMQPISEDFDDVTWLKRLTFNNKKRLQLYRAFNEQLAGKPQSSPNSTKCNNAIESRKTIASTQETSTPIKKIQVLHINGVDTDEISAKRNAFWLEWKTNKAVTEALSSANLGTFEVEYSHEWNITQGAPADLVQVLQQKIAEEGINLTNLSAEYVAATAADWIFDSIDEDKIEQLELLLLYSDIPGSDVSTIIDLIDDDESIFLQAALEALINTYYDSSLVEIDYMNSMLSERYRRNMELCVNTIVIPHSQGNLFANSSVSLFLDKHPEYANKIGIFGVASPAEQIVNIETYGINENDSYITAHQDTVINSLGLLFNVLKSNMSAVDAKKRDNLSHGLRKTYLSSATSRGLIVEGIVRYATTQEFNECSPPTEPFEIVYPTGAPHNDTFSHVYSNTLTNDLYRTIELAATDQSGYLPSITVTWDTEQHPFIVTASYFSDNNYNVVDIENGHVLPSLPKDQAISLAIKLTDADMPDAGKIASEIVFTSGVDVQMQRVVTYRTPESLPDSMSNITYELGTDELKLMWQPGPTVEGFEQFIDFTIAKVDLFNFTQEMSELNHVKASDGELTYSTEIERSYRFSPEFYFFTDEPGEDGEQIEAGYVLDANSRGLYTDIDVRAPHIGEFRGKVTYTCSDGTAREEEMEFDVSRLDANGNIMDTYLDFGFDFGFYDIVYSGNGFTYTDVIEGSYSANWNSVSGTAYIGLRCDAQSGEFEATRITP